MQFVLINFFLAILAGQKYQDSRYVYVCMYFSTKQSSNSY